MTEFFAHSPGLRLFSRTAAAVLGGYLLSSAWVVFCGALLPARAEAVLAGVQTSWVVYVAAVVWAFSPGPQARAWGGLLLPAAGLAAAAALLTRWGG